MSITSTSNEGPLLVSILIEDFIVRLFASQVIMIALLEREPSDKR